MSHPSSTLLPTPFQRGLTTAGVTLGVVMVASWLALVTSDYHTLQREAAITVFNFTAWLELTWTPTAAVFALVRWRSTALKFRLTLLLNAIIVALLLAELVAAIW